MEQLEFVFTYGQPEQHKKSKKILNDPNRQYMIKYKYDTITPQELNIFHNQIQKLIYDTIRKNYVQLQIKDVYQEIWKKISKAKHSWNENMGTRVSTWIVLVCMSVINGLRMKAKKHQDRFVLYNDLNVKEDENESNEKGQMIAIKFGLVDDKQQRIAQSKQDIKYFLDSLSQNEKKVVDIILNVQPEELTNNIKYKRKRVTKTFLCSKMDMKQKDFNNLMDGIQRKFRKLVMHRDNSERCQQE